MHNQVCSKNTMECPPNRTSLHMLEIACAARLSVAYFETANTEALLEGSFVRASFRGVATGRADKIFRISCNCPACASVSISCMFSLFSFVLISSLQSTAESKATGQGEAD